VEAEVGDAEPAGDEVWYAEPWDASNNPLGYKTILYIFSILYWIIVTFILCFTAYLFFPIDHLVIKAVDDFITLAFEIIIILWLCYLMYCMWVIAISQFTSRLKNNGWYDNKDTIKQIKKRKTFFTVTGMFFIVYNLISLLTITNMFDMYITMFIIISMTIVGIIIFIIEKTISRNSDKYFDIEYDDCFYLLEMNGEILIPEGSWRTKLFWRKIFMRDKIKIIIQNSFKQTHITIKTPFVEEKRNRELREAVSAILEGRPWPPEAGARDEAQPP